MLLDLLDLPFERKDEHVRRDRVHGPCEHRQSFGEVHRRSHGRALHREAGAQGPVRGSCRRYSWLISIRCAERASVHRTVISRVAASYDHPERTRRRQAAGERLRQRSPLIWTAAGGLSAFTTRTTSVRVGGTYEPSGSTHIDDETRPDPLLCVCPPEEHTLLEIE